MFRWISISSNINDSKINILQVQSAFIDIPWRTLTDFQLIVVQLILPIEFFHVCVRQRSRSSDEVVHALEILFLQECANVEEQKYRRDYEEARHLRDEKKKKKTRKRHSRNILQNALCVKIKRRDTIYIPTEFSPCASLKRQ